MTPLTPTRRLTILDIVKKIDIEIIANESILKTETKSDWINDLLSQNRALKELKDWIYEKYEKGVSL